MKQFFSLFIAAILLMSCTDNVVNNELLSTNNKIENKFEYIINKAINARSEYYPESTSRSTKINSSIDFIVDTKSRSDNPDTLIYVVNFSNNDGYALIANDRTDNKLLGIVPRGSYSVENGTDNPGLNYYLNYAKNYVSSTLSTQWELDTTYKRNPEYKIVYDTIYYYHCNPRLGEIEWGQGMLYGKYCPNTICGCVPLAMGQIIAYYGFQKYYEPNLKFTFKNGENAIPRKLDSQTVSWKRIYQHKREEVKRFEKVNGIFDYVT